MTWRTATADDAVALRDLEREANLVGLAHVFPGAAVPRRRGAGALGETLADPTVTTAVFVTAAAVALSAYDAAGRLRHLAVHPDQWGTGLAPQGWSGP